jgi:hypothetical protein
VGRGMSDQDDLREQYQAKVREIVESAPHDDALARTMAYTEAIRIADSHADELLGYRLRLEMIESAHEAERNDIALVAFAWCLAYDDKKGEGSEYMLLWRYKWIIAGLTNFPDITSEQIDNALEDMKRRYADAGYGVKAYHQLRLTSNLSMGRFDNWQPIYEAWQVDPTDGMTDCTACRINTKVDMLASLGRLDEAMKAAKPLIGNHIRCRSVPESTVGKVLLPLLKEKRFEEARKVAALKARRIGKEREFLLEASKVMLFLALDDDLPRALKWLETLSRWTATSTSVNSHFWYFNCGLGVLKVLEKAGRKTITLRLAEEMPGYQETLSYDVSALADSYRTKAGELAERFNRRNGNRFFDQLLAETESLVELYPLPKPE